MKTTITVVTVRDVLTNIPTRCGKTRAYLTDLVRQKSTGLQTPLYAVLTAGDIASLPVGVSRNRLAVAIASAYLDAEVPL